MYTPYVEVLDGLGFPHDLGLPIMDVLVVPAGHFGHVLHRGTTLVEEFAAEWIRGRLSRA